MRFAGVFQATKGTGSVMSKAQRTILAVIIAPIAAPLVFMLCGIGLSILEGSPLITTSEPFQELFLGFAAISMISLPASYIAMLLLGTPTILLLKKYDNLRLSCLVVTSALEGIIVIFLFFGFFSGFSISSLFAHSVILTRIVIGAAMAIGVAVTFWYLSGYNYRFYGTSVQQGRR